MTDYLDDGTDVTTCTARELAIRAVNSAMVAQAIAEKNAALIAEHTRKHADAAAEAVRLREMDLQLAEALGGIGRELGTIRELLGDLVRMVVAYQSKAVPP